MRLENKSEIFRLDRSDIELLQGVTYFSIIRSLAKRKLQYHLELYEKTRKKHVQEWEKSRLCFELNREPR